MVSHETEGLTKITSAEPLKENGTFKTLAFGDSINYSSTNTIGSFLNGEYLDSGSCLTSEQVDMIEDNTTWYLGTVGNGTSYKLAKYTDTNMSSLTSNTTTAKVRFLRYGELMSGQFDIIGNNIYYWTLTPYSTSYVRSMNNNGRASYSNLTNAIGIRSALNLKSNVIITGGDGTKNNPFTLELR